MESIKIYDLDIVGIGLHVVVRDFEIVVTPNQHATAKLVLELSSGQIKDSQLERIINSNITINCNKKILFSGICQDLKINDIIEKGVSQLTILLMSYSIKTDLVKEKRSFQDCGLTYEQIMDAVLSKEKCGLIYNASEMHGNMPLIQYKETAWEFVHRLTSRLNSVMYPLYNELTSSLQVGLQCKKRELKGEILDLKMCFCEDYWQKREKLSASHDDFIYYELETYENFEIGDVLNLDGKNSTIWDKRIRIEGEELIFSYKAGSISAAALTHYNNQYLAGLSIKGTVLSTTKETLRMKFEFDEKQDESSAYDYIWVPETGNTMYLMPQKGTTVNLFFKNEAEESAIAISCIRINGSQHTKMTNTDNRYLTNQAGKQLEMKPDCLGFINESTEEGIVMNDESQIAAQTKNNISIVSSKKLSIKAKNIYFETPNEVILKKVRL